MNRLFLFFEFLYQAGTMIIVLMGLETMYLLPLRWILLCKAIFCKPVQSEST